MRELENTVHRLYISEKEHIIDGIAVDMLINESLYDICLLYTSDAADD